MKLPILMCFLFVFYFYFVFDFDFINRGDFEAHYKMSAGLDSRPYAPLSHFIGSFFAYNKQSFTLYALVLIFLVTPMLLWQLHRSFLTVLFYFGTQYPFFMLMSISQGLSGIFLLGLFIFKNNYLRFLMLLGGLSSHSKGGILILIAWALILFFEKIELKKALNFFPACGSILGKNSPEFLSEKLLIATNQHISLATIGNLFVKIIPFPFLFFGLLQLFKERNFAPVLLSIIAFIAIFFQIDRTLYVIPLMIVPFAAKFFQNKKFKYNLAITIFSIGLIIFQVWVWIRIKTACI